MAVNWFLCHFVVNLSLTYDCFTEEDDAHYLAMLDQEEHRK
jgi:hypothetical protein